MAKKKQSVPEYGTVTRKGTLYYRTRITDADGKQVSLYATTCEELYEKQLEGRRQVEEIIFRRKHPTVAEYCEKWLLMQSAKVSMRDMNWGLPQLKSINSGYGRCPNHKRRRQDALIFRNRASCLLDGKILFQIASYCVAAKRHSTSKHGIVISQYQNALVRVEP